MPWNPRQYLGFAGERLRPAVDLLARVDLDRPSSLLDLGCGAGNVTRLLAERWPDAALAGVDRSTEMLAAARSTLPGARWVEADLRTWKPPEPVDLVFSNAALHWVDGHGDLFPRLAGWLRPGGVLAVQMPASFDHASHRAARDLARTNPWRERFRHLPETGAVHPLADYHAWLSPWMAALDLWETTYLHVLEGEDPVTEWFKGSLLVPYLEALAPEHREAFVDAYRGRVRVAYPKQADGRTLLAFHRVFMVGRVQDVP